MSDVQKTKALEKFMEENNLTVLNNVALCSLLMKQQEQIDEIAKNKPNTTIGFDNGTMKHKALWGYVESLFDKWNNK